MAFPDSSWPCGCDYFCVQSMSPEKEKVTIFWNIESFLRECQEERKELRSDVFGFADATWNLFTSFDQKEAHSLFGINVRPLRLSDAVFDCHCTIELRGRSFKRFECKFKCESTDSHWVTEKFLSNSELKEFLRWGREIVCCISPKKLSIKEVSPRTEITHPSRSSSVDAHTQDQLFPDSTWSCDSDKWVAKCTTSKDVSIKWLIGSFLLKCREERNGLRSYDFGFAGARWNLCISLDRKNNHTLFGINFKPYRLSDEVFDCNCTIRLCNCGSEIKKIEGRFKCGNNSVSHWATENFLSNSELENFILRCNEIDCTIYLRKLSIKEACSGAASNHSSSNGVVEDQAQTQLLKNNKICHDLKQLMLSEEYSDVILQVRDQQFKAHRSILAARSSVFAATFRCNMKEKATGVVDIKDCDPSSFPVLLEFIYTGCTDKLSVENVFGIYTSADKYDIQELKLDCLEFMKNNLCIETFCETVKLSMMHSENSLLTLSIDFFAKNMNKIILTAKWKRFILEDPIQGNEILIKAFGADSQAD